MKITFLLFILFFLSIAITSTAQQLSNQPVLRIETGEHYGKLTGVSVDNANSFLVTVNEDKTARVWELSTGKQLSVLRPPIGEGKVGMLYASAISPDGKIIAVGGWTGNESERNFSVYLFDRESGRIQRRINDFSDVILSIAFSSNGKYLGVTTGNGGGLRVYETQDYSLIGQDRDYTERSERLDFDPTGTKIVTSSTDGFLRLYDIKDNGLKLLHKQTVKGGNLAYGVKFSPDGGSIAVGFVNSKAIAVVASTDLSFLYAPDVSRVNNGDLADVAWSVDGRKLYAAGLYKNTKGESLICSWTNNGQNYNETVAGTHLIKGIQPLNKGGIAFAQVKPAWGVIDENGQRTKFIASVMPNYGNDPQGLLVNEDTTYWKYSKSLFENQWSFSLPQRKLAIENNSVSDLKAPYLETAKLQIVDCCNRKEPSLNGKKLKLDRFERSTSLAILPDEKAFLLGTIWWLRKFDSNGNLSWRVSVPVPANSINISRNGKVAVVSLIDGTIRWYRISDGQELLSFFSPFDQSNRWILWTPSGYYDAASGAEDLIGWHVNNGADAAPDFFPIHLFKTQYYRPDIIDRVLQTADEDLAVKLANEKLGIKDQQLSIAKVLPPVVEIESSRVKEVSSSTTKIRYSVRAPSGEPVTNIRAFIDGREVKLSDSEKAKTPKDIAEISVQLPNKESELTLIAENRFTKSLPAKVQFKRQRQ